MLMSRTIVASYSLLETSPSGSLVKEAMCRFVCRCRREKDLGGQSMEQAISLRGSVWRCIFLRSHMAVSLSHAPSSVQCRQIEAFNVGAGFRFLSRRHSGRSTSRQAFRTVSSFLLDSEHCSLVLPFSLIAALKRLFSVSFPASSPLSSSPSGGVRAVYLSKISLLKRPSTVVSDLGKCALSSTGASSPASTSSSRL